MRKISTIILVVLMIATCCVGLTACGDEDGCFICGGSGYYQKKDCPGC